VIKTFKFNGGYKLHENYTVSPNFFAISLCPDKVVTC